MDFSSLLKPEMITAASVGLGALLGGVVAVISEVRRPAAERRQAKEDAEARDDALVAEVRAECDHVNRSVWIVEKKLSDRMHAVEKRIEALAAKL